MKVNGISLAIFNAKNTEILILTDLYLWKFENGELQNRKSNLYWKYGYRIWRTAESLENLLESKCGKIWFG